MDVEAWSQGSWNAFVVFDCSKEVSRQRCREVPDRFKKVAISHATTYWGLQDTAPHPRKRSNFAGMSTTYQQWTCLEMTAEDLEWGEQHLKKVLAAGKTAPSRNFGDRAAGFSAERVVDRWLTAQGVEHDWDDDPKNRLPDFQINGLTIDLKNHTTVGSPKADYDANLTERQRINSGPRDWYLFSKLDKSTMRDLWVLGFQTYAVMMDKGVFYREGEITRKNMNAPVDCWCIRFDELIKPTDWLGEYK